MFILHSGVESIWWQSTLMFNNSLLFCKLCRCFNERNSPSLPWQWEHIGGKVRCLALSNKLIWYIKDHYYLISDWWNATKEEAEELQQQSKHIGQQQQPSATRWRQIWHTVSIWSKWTEVLQMQVSRRRYLDYWPGMLPGAHSTCTFCRRISFGSMVACENPDCPIEWFHFECVGLKIEVRFRYNIALRVRMTLLTHLFLLLNSLRIPGIAPAAETLRSCLQSLQ